MENEITNQASGDSSQVSDNGKNNDSVSYESHKKLLIEKKNLQAKFQELQSKVESFEQSDLEAKGKQSELIESLRTQLTESNKKLEETKSSYAWNTVRSQVEKEAISQGCVNTKAFVKLMSNDDFSSIEVDDNFKVNGDDLKRIVEKNRVEFKDIGLFKKEKVNVNDLSSGSTKPPKKPLNELSKEELYKKLNE